MTDTPQKKDADKKKLLAPTYHFITEQIKIGDDYTTDKIPVTELVEAGQLLVNYPNFHRFAAKGFEKEAVELGENTHLSEDEESILATVPGYPKIKKMPSKTSAELVSVISVEPLFIVSADFMKVTLALHPSLEKGRKITIDDINTQLGEQNITFGIEPKALEKIGNILAEDEKEFNKVVVARGQAVGESVDAYLHFDMEIGPIAGTLLEDGSIDFRDRRVMVSVNAGQQIATKIPAVQGEPGINVYGEETPAKEGKDLKVTILNDVSFSTETLKVTATKDGVVSVVNNNVIKVLSHTTIASDIDYETGNVESANCVTIQGSVQPGFKVTAGGDIKITGSVMSAHAACEGNLVVNGGTTGKNSTLKANGDADINFIEQGQLQCGGICVIRKQSYYSDITAGGDIRCKPHCKIIGGRVVAEGNITLGDVGSENATPSLIAAGVVPARLDHLTELKQSVVQQQEEIIQWLQRYRGSSRSKKVRKMEDELASTKLSLLRVNLIPGSGIYSRAGGPDDSLPGDSEDFNAEKAIDITEIQIDVFGEIYSGTEIRIGNRNLKIEKTVSNRQFKLHPNGKRILAVPLKGKHR